MINALGFRAAQRAAILGALELRYRSAGPGKLSCRRFLQRYRPQGAGLRNISYLTKCSFTFFANLSGCHPERSEGTGATAPKNKAQKAFFRILPRFLRYAQDDNRLGWLSQKQTGMAC